MNGSEGGGAVEAANISSGNSSGYDADVRTPIRNPPDPMYAEFEVHRTMICDRVRTEAFRRAIDSVVRPATSFSTSGPEAAS